MFSLILWLVFMFESNFSSHYCKNYPPLPFFFVHESTFYIVDCQIPHNLEQTKGEVPLPQPASVCLVSHIHFVAFTHLFRRVSHVHLVPSHVASSHPRTLSSNLISSSQRHSPPPLCPLLRRWISIRSSRRWRLSRLGSARKTSRSAH